jgi:transcriptional regulator with XRE-family HTH domain
MTTDPRELLRRRVGLNIRNLRKLQGLNQEQLAKLIGIPRPQLSRWETGNNQPSARYLARIAEALECDIGYFYVDHTLADGEQLDT